MRDSDVRTGGGGASATAFALSLAIFLAGSPMGASAFRVSIDSDSTVVADSGRSSDWEKGSKDVVRMGQDIEIASGETIEGDVVAIGGRITVGGKVQGDVVSVGGGVHLLPGSVVRGDVVTVGGKLDREPGATVLGQNVSVGPAGALGWIPHISRGRFHRHENAGIQIGKDILRSLVFFIIGLIIFFAFPKRMGVVRETIRSRFWLSLVVGFGSIIGVSAALVLLLITCIGIFVAIPGALIFILALVATGAVATSLLGEAIIRRPVTSQGEWIRSLVIGLVILLALRIISQLLMAPGGGFWYGLGQTLRVIDKMAWAVLVMVGFGSLILSRLGSRTMQAQPWISGSPAGMGAGIPPAAPPGVPPMTPPGVPPGASPGPSPTPGT